MNSLINKLNNKEIEIIASLAAIETKAYSVNKLFEMFQIESYEHLDFFETIHDLSKKEVLGNSKDTYYLNIDYKNI
ncbi:MAG: hypothetical protein JXA16_13070, partial [Bacteroidales bacterium]|nr:hypothetical protein [Bacteroidales bacterium]